MNKKLNIRRGIRRILVIASVIWAILISLWYSNAHRVRDEETAICVGIWGQIVAWFVYLVWPLLSRWVLRGFQISPSPVRQKFTFRRGIFRPLVVLSIFWSIFILICVLTPYLTEGMSDRPNTHTTEEIFGKQSTIEPPPGFVLDETDRQSMSELQLAAAAELERRGWRTSPVIDSEPIRPEPIPSDLKLALFIGSSLLGIFWLTYWPISPLVWRFLKWLGAGFYDVS